MLSFSTCWNSHRHTDGEIMLSEIRLLGFTAVELSLGLQIGLIPGIRRLHKRGRVSVTSFRNFCPAPFEVLVDDTDRLKFTTSSKAEREMVLKYTRHTIDYAAEFETPVVIIRLGEVSASGLTDRLLKMVEKGKLHSRDFVKAKLGGIKERQKISDRYVERAREILDEVISHAAKRGVKIALELGEGLEGVPNEREMLRLMEHYKDNPWIGYWHDFGAAEAKANLGLLQHQQWLESMTPHLLGVHLHDVVWPGTTHRVPLSGMVEFENLMPLVSDNLPVVWELSPDRRTADIKQALPAWEQRFGSRARR